MRRQPGTGKSAFGLRTQTRGKELRDEPCNERGNGRPSRRGLTQAAKGPSTSHDHRDAQKGIDEDVRPNGRPDERKLSLCSIYFMLITRRESRFRCLLANILQTPPDLRLGQKLRGADSWHSLFLLVWRLTSSLRITRAKWQTVRGDPSCILSDAEMSSFQDLLT